MKFLLECTVAITDSICLSSCYIICIKGFNLVAGYADTCGTLWDSLDSQGCFCMVTPINSDKQTKCFSYGLKTVEAFFSRYLHVSSNDFGRTMSNDGPYDQQAFAPVLP